MVQSDKDIMNELKDFDPSDPWGRNAVKIKLEKELQKRLWELYDAAKALECKSGDNPTAELWAKFFIALGNVPPSQRPKA